MCGQSSLTTFARMALQDTFKGDRSATVPFKDELRTMWQKMTKRYRGRIWISKSCDKLKCSWSADVTGSLFISFHIFFNHCSSYIHKSSTNHPQIIHKSSINHPKSSKIIQMSDRSSYCSRFLPHQSSNPQRYGRPRTQWSTSTTGWPASNAIVGPETQLASPVALKLRSLSLPLYMYIYIWYICL